MHSTIGGKSVHERDADGPPMVALLGRANVGKSTLFNRLLRNSRALVDDRPGATRDRIVAETEIERRKVLLVDTGGLDPEAEQGLPAAVRRQAERVMQDADVILLVTDARTGVLPLDREIANRLRRAEKRVIVVANKTDGVQLDAAVGEFYGLGFDTIVATSAEHRRGIADLEITIARMLPEKSGVVPHVDPNALRIAIIGRPNVGKSSLLNALVDGADALVADEPGTTRDTTDSWIKVGERDVVLIDTAGLRKQARRSDRLERGSAHMAFRALQRADVALLLIDAIEGVTDQDAKVARLALDTGRSVILGVNKCDEIDPSTRRPELAKQLDRKLGFVRDPEIVFFSALTGQGVKKLLPSAISVHDASQQSFTTHRINEWLEEAVARNAPPAMGKKPARFYYATQVSIRPTTILIFVSNPEYVPVNYRRYLESYLRTKMKLRSGPLRLRLRARSRAGDETPSEPGPKRGSSPRRR